MDQGGDNPAVLGRLPLAAIIRHPAWDSARRGATDRLDAGAPIVAVLGVAGVGKTTLLGHLSREFRRRGRAVRSRQDDGAALREAVTATAAPVTILDDAHTVPDATLLALREAGAALLAGPPDLEGRLLDLGLDFAPVAFRPLRAEEVSDFVAARLTASGQPPDLLTPDAVEELFARSGGVPRLVNGLVRSALFSASLEDAPHVTARHIAEAAEPGASTIIVTAPADPLVARAVIAPAPSPAPESSAPEPAIPPSASPPFPVETPAPLVARVTLRAGDAVDGDGPAHRPPSPDATAPIARPVDVPPATAKQPEATLSDGAPRVAPATPLRATAPLARRVLPVRAPFRHAAAVALLVLGAGAVAWLAVAGPRGAREAEAEVATEWTEPPSREPPSQMVSSDVSPAPGPTPSPVRTATAAPVRAAPRATPPAAPPAAPTQAVAVPGAARIVLHRPEGSSSAEANALAATASLGQGFGTVETRTVRGAPRVPTIRYFHEGDAATAGRVARSLTGGPWRVQDMTSFRPSPRPGTVEVWFPS